MKKISFLLAVILFCSAAMAQPVHKQFAYELREGDTRPKPKLTPSFPSLAGKGESKEVRSTAGWQPNGIAVCDTTPSALPKIVTDGNSGAIICWTECYRDQVNLDDDIYAQRVDSGGNFVWPSQGVPVCSLKGSYSNYPAMISDGKGGAIIAWEDSRGGLGYTRVFAQRLDSSGNRLWTENGVLVCNQMSGYVDLCGDGHGGAIIAYVDGRNEATTSDDIYAQRIDSAGNPVWAVDGVPVCIADNIQFYPSIASDLSNGAIISWKDSRNGNYDIYAQRILDDGIPKWQDNGVAACTTAGASESYNKNVTDNLQGGIIGWTNGDISIQRIDSSGSKLWGINGVLISSEPGAQTGPSLVNDTLGNAYICWSNALDTNMFIQKILTDGELVWGANGIMVTDSPGGGYQITITADNHVVVVWDDYRNNSGDANQYAQKIDDTGNSMWQTNGVPVCTLRMGSTTGPQITSDNLGGVVVAWYGSPIHGTNHIYAQRLYSNGTVGGVEGNPVTTLKSLTHKLTAYPNPFYSSVIISFTLGKKQYVSLNIYNIAGQKVKSVARGNITSGVYVNTWDGKDDAGYKASAGIYFIHFLTDSNTETVKTILIK